MFAAGLTKGCLAPERHAVTAAALLLAALSRNGHHRGGWGLCARHRSSTSEENGERSDSSSGVAT
ncbi:hypothetical protein MNEG_14401, partial [Monoraphidium neglectum]